MQKQLLKIAFVGLILALGTFVRVSFAQAQFGAGQAFGTIGKGGVSGVKATVWTAQQPNLTNNWIASPVGLCTTLPPCTGGFVETGYIKGHGVQNLQSNVLQQYIAWKSSTGSIINNFGYGNLNDFTYYNFIVLSQPNKNRFVIRRDNLKVGTVPYNFVDFINGRMVACGAETNTSGTYIAVECNGMSYYYNGAWTLFNYTYAQTSPGYCVFKPFDYGATGWGPC